MISIIVPIYNIEKYIEKCIFSLINQTYRDIEILLINDGSTDDSLDVCLKWEKLDQRIRVYSKDNQGVSKTRNFGLSLAKGDYIFFIDGDDWIDKNCLETMMNYMNDEIDIVCCEFKEIDENNGDFDLFSHSNQYGILEKNDIIQDYYLNKLYMKTIWGKIYKKELWNHIKFIDLKYSEDTYAMFEIAQKTNKLVMLEKAFYNYLQRNEGASHNKSIQYYENLSFTNYHNYLKAKEKYKEYITISANDYINFSFVLLKLYIKKKQKEKAKQLIKKMKKVNKDIPFNEKSNAQILLCMNVLFVYKLIVLKVRRKIYVN